MSCSCKTTSKYTKRPGPPYPAQKHRGQYKFGNDKFLYLSKRASNGVYRWVPADARIGERRARKAKITRSKSRRKVSRRKRSKSTRARKTSRRKTSKRRGISKRKRSTSVRRRR